MPKKPAMSPSGAPVATVLDALPARRRDEAEALMRVMGEVTGEPATVWASRIIGFGSYKYRYMSGHEGEAPLISFAASLRHHAIYLIGDFEQRHQAQVAKLGPYTSGKGCLYIKRLADVDIGVLRVLIERSTRVRRGVDSQSRET